MRHIFTHELSQLARGIESAFFRIERGTSLLRSALSGAIAGLAVLSERRAAASRAYFDRVAAISRFWMPVSSA